jgi:hypothetical protein
VQPTLLQTIFAMLPLRVYCIMALLMHQVFT